MNIKDSNTKTQLGQFYTTNYAYILQNMKIPLDTTAIIEPFVGQGDLLHFIDNIDNYTLELFDINPKCAEYTNIIKKDTLLNPPLYSNKFILTNPPYLARNKNQDKTLYHKYNCNDLYKCFIMNITDNDTTGGIIIVPLNFICSIRKADCELRKRFFKKFNVELINIFEERVFDDTGYSVCSIYFTRKTIDKPVNITIYPSKKKLEITFNEVNNYTIGGEIYTLPINKDYKISRATKYTKKEDISNIKLKCIDDNINSKLGFTMVSDDNKFIDTTEKLSARSYASLVFNKKITLEEQTILVKKINKYIDTHRDKYHSLFLANYRESNSIARKRISFGLAFNICNYVLSSSQ